MTQKIYYIHGYGSSVNSETLKKLQEYYPDAIGLTYDVSNPIHSLSKMASKINSEYEDTPLIIGSSLGGWYAEQLADYVIADYILYNPCISPDVTLAKYGLSDSVLNNYKIKCGRRSPRTIVLSMDDEIIDPELTIDKYSDNAAIIKTSGGHRMTDHNMSLIVEQAKYLENQIP